MPVYHTSDAREFGNKQGTLPPPFKRKKGGEIQPGEMEAAATGSVWRAGRRWFRGGEGEFYRRLRLVGSRALMGVLMGSEHQEQSGNFHDGTLCSPVQGNSFILGAILTLLA